MQCDADISFTLASMEGKVMRLSMEVKQPYTTPLSFKPFFSKRDLRNECHVKE